MNVVTIGTGYVGLVTGVCLADKGHNVFCVDIDENKIKLLNNEISPIYEDRLEELMSKNKNLLHYTTDYMSACKNADVIFIGVGTPEKNDGSANLNYVFSAVKNIVKAVEHDCVVVIKSTVPIGTNDKIEHLINDTVKDGINISIVSNPEFLAQGTAVNDTLYPSRIVIGTNNDNAANIMKELYKDFDAPILIMDRKSAEMVKYASNDFLALKISYINEIANICEIIGANVEDVTKGMSYDERIGNKFLNPGIGYGGSCFPKDTKALHWLANMNDYEIKTIKAAIEVNEQQKFKLIKKAKKRFETFNGLKVAVLGLTFKPGTDDLREAPSLVNIPILLEDGAIIKAWDPVGIPNFKKVFSEEEISYCDSIDEAIKGADVCFIFTEWSQIKNYDTSKFSRFMNNPIIYDGRNCFKKVDKSVEYISIGRNI